MAGTARFDTSAPYLFTPLDLFHVGANIAAGPVNVCALNPGSYGFDFLRVDWCSVNLDFAPIDLAAGAQLAMQLGGTGDFVPFLTTYAYLSTGGGGTILGNTDQLTLPFYTTGLTDIQLRGSHTFGSGDSTMAATVCISGARSPVE
jgi:hypothetical protein